MPDAQQQIGNVVASYDYQAAVIKMTLAFVGLLICIFFIAWLLKKISKGGFWGAKHSAHIKVLDKKALSPKTMLYWIEVSGVKIVISEAQLEVRPLTSSNSLSFEEEENRD